VNFCTYIYRDPKSNVPIYIGMGKVARPESHLRTSHNRRLGATLKKRIAEGFTLTPQVLPAETRADAVEMEMLLIDLIGRADLRTGTLFNLTPGGDGGAACSGHTATGRKNISLARCKAYATTNLRQRQSETMKAKAMRGEHVGGRTKQPCAVGDQVFESRKALIKAMGQGKSGLKSPNFKWIT
jgi:hypothetical protein